jgi:hypothetical protein
MLSKPIYMNDFISLKYTHEEANKPIEVYQGEFQFQLESNDTSRMVSFEGEIQFRWFPVKGVYFKGKPKADEQPKGELWNSWKAGTYYDLEINGIVAGNFQLTHIQYKTTPRGRMIQIMEGFSSEESVIMDKSIAVKKVKFCIPNMRDFHGEGIVFHSQNGSKSCRGEILLHTEKFVVKIHKHINFEERYKELKRSGGYFINYYGEITVINEKDDITQKEANKLLKCLNKFLSLLNGREVSSMLMEGIYDEETQWIDCSSQPIQPFKYCVSMYKNYDIDGIQDLWINFKETWENESSNNFLDTVIHWYLEANYRSGGIQGAMIMAQAGLELLYNYIVVEQKGIILGKDSENIKAANKIRILLSQIQVENLIPSNLIHLKSFIESRKDCTDGADALVYIRNSMVHGQQKKRDDLNKIAGAVLNEALELALWYIELSILSVLKYEGVYYNRCLKKGYNSESEELVPWAK